MVQHKDAENRAHELKQTNIDLEGRLLRSDKEKHFYHDKVKNMEKILERKEKDIVDLEQQLIELRDTKFDKS